MIKAAWKILKEVIPWQAWALAGVLGLAGAWHWRETSAAYDRGRADEQQAAKIEAGKRIIEMEKANESFRSLSARDRCIAFLRDSGLPEHHCGER